jgi:mono/diheme cytochrome c family protein
MTKHWKVLHVAILLAGFAGCEAMQSRAPAIGAEMAKAAAANGDSTETLAAGRRLLATRCVSCHSLEPIAKFTPAQWEANVLRMANRSGLSEAEAQKITAYLVAARESL